MSQELDAWLAQTVEEPLDPELPICDPHHHLWEDRGNRFTPYLLPELRRDTADHNVVHTVFVDCMSHYRTEGPEELRPVGETEFVRQVAEGSARTPGCKIMGIVGFADMTLGDAAQPVLEAHVEAGGWRFKGIRHASSWDPSPDIGGYRNPPPGLLLDATVRKGIACLDRMELSFDAQVYHHQLLEVASLACAFPGMPIILNHTGIPLAIGPYADKRDETFTYWRASMAELARCENVFVKVGGFGMGSFGFGWHERERPAGSEAVAAAIAPMVHACIELFDPARCMFESNFPVDRMAFSFTVLWNAFKRVTQDLSPSEKADLFHDTAARAYRLT